ncbi:benzoate/H(+) symporter BenE family transporter [Pseudoxanthomonas mexicana]|uniref:Benzoate/H(+) symporter BenE family transporter n=1 Tax=Pseudoxanthomonas mexicana TaxID=128785 RepID=A0ABX6R7S4_PSEMX|nr:benzoate/H(+) symporter BenE family transporter [Pseudoxanthomonas mexicana]QLQ27716.1 MAG: benzoate/H(+) symporter BenE family transporter [Pseudoxanthomonas sp.]QND79262.1 benzoate/H(+) symporter BenE family transporter [Pseudoxanthomonas mexicana]
MSSPPRHLLKDLSLSAIAAGFVTVLVGFASSAVIVFQAAQSLGATPEEISSWMWALGLGMGLTCIGLSLRYRMPVVTAWSTPGAAMLIGSVAGLPLSDAIGAFLMSALLIAASGFSGLFERMISRIPVSLASGMLAGVLLRFGIDAFAAMKTQLGMVLTMFAVYLLARRLLPRYAVILTLLVGIAFAAGLGLLRVDGLSLQLAKPVFTTPTFSLAAIVGIALPLFIVTMASQNVPGVAVIRASGYAIPISPVVGWTGLVNLLLAPFGAFALNLAAITAAICMGREAHEDAARRYVAAIAAGVFYVVVGLFGATVAALFAAFPKELILAIAGIALLGTIGNSLAAALRDEAEREPALVTFLVTASGLSLAGIGSAFWGLLAGVVTLLVLRRT